MKGMDRSKLWRSPVKYARKGPRPRRGPLLTESGYAAVMAKTPSTRRTPRQLGEEAFGQIVVAVDEYGGLAHRSAVHGESQADGLAGGGGAGQGQGLAS